MAKLNKKKKVPYVYKPQSFGLAEERLAPISPQELGVPQAPAPSQLQGTFSTLLNNIVGAPTSNPALQSTSSAFQSGLQGNPYQTSYNNDLAAYNKEREAAVAAQQPKIDLLNRTTELYNQTIDTLNKSDEYAVQGLAMGQGKSSLGDKTIAYDPQAIWDSIYGHLANGETDYNPLVQLTDPNHLKYKRQVNLSDPNAHESVLAGVQNQMAQLQGVGDSIQQPNALNYAPPISQSLMSQPNQQSLLSGDRESRMLQPKQFNIPNLNQGQAPQGMNRFGEIFKQALQQPSLEESMNYVRSQSQELGEMFSGMVSDYTSSLQEGAAKTGGVK